MFKLAFKTIFVVSYWMLSAIVYWLMTVLGILTFLAVITTYIIGATIVCLIDSTIEFFLDLFHIKRGQRGN